MLGAVVVPLCVALDWFALPAPVFERFLQFRAGLTAALALQLVLIRITRPSRFSFLHGYAFTLMVAGVISWMTVELGGFDSPYYVGLNLVIAANLLLPWRPVHAVLNSLLTVLVYVVLNSIFGGPFHTAVLLNNLSFLGAAAVIAVIAARIRYRLVRREHEARTGLLEANAALDRSQAELQAARDALWGEMEVAKRIQTALLPEDRRVGPYQIAARMVPAAEVGGDYYDIVDAGDGRHWIAIGDVSGHGVESGLVMMMTQTSILSLVRERPSRTPAEVFREVNGVLWQNISRMRANRYMTLNVVRLEPNGLTMAGKHQDVLVWRRGHGVETVSNEGCWIGLVPDSGTHARDSFVPHGARRRRPLLHGRCHGGAQRPGRDVRGGAARRGADARGRASARGRAGRALRRHRSLPGRRARRRRHPAPRPPPGRGARHARSGRARGDRERLTGSCRGRERYPSPAPPPSSRPPAPRAGSRAGAG